jgi:hypothetical protein
MGEKANLAMSPRLCLGKITPPDYSTQEIKTAARNAVQDQG